jgi:threonine synthase
MHYISTRDKKKKSSFRDVFLNALSPDGGLYVPEELPVYSLKELDEISKFSYKDLAANIICKFCSDEFSEKEVKEIVKNSYKNFREKEVVHLKKYDHNYLLELFHGPTLAFKDIAMQVIGNMYQKILYKENSIINIVVATSGDTGAAAINALKGRNNINIFVLHPKGKTSDVQRKFMTTTEEKNVFNIAIKGNFDDCQSLVKSMFTDVEFKNQINMSGVNSINWARIISQIVYFFYAYFKIIQKKEGKINFSVPTGNFGDIYAGYVAKKMGLPINKLIIATNQNDILKRAINQGEYKIENVAETISPSMDIQVASNFERLIFNTNLNNEHDVIEKMKNLKKEKFFKIEKNQLEKIKCDFIAESLSEKETEKTIHEFYNKFKYILDPHTAVAFGVLNKISCEGINVVLATAHPSKFPKVIFKVLGETPKLPDRLMNIMNKKENYDVVDNDPIKIKNYILSKI